MGACIAKTKSVAMGKSEADTDYSEMLGNLTKLDNLLDVVAKKNWMMNSVGSSRRRGVGVAVVLWRRAVLP